MTFSPSRIVQGRLVHRLITVLPLALLGIASAFTLAGCPVGAELEDPERFGVGGTTGGTAPATGGTTAGTGSPSGGSAGSTAGTSGLVVDCDYATMLTASCAKTACHDARYHYADLQLTPDAALATRLKDVPATHGDLDCTPTGSADFVECVPPEPPACVPFMGALLVNSANPDASWIFTKVNGMQEGCGETMPVSVPSFDAARRDCLDKLVRAIAALPPQ